MNWPEQNSQTSRGYKPWNAPNPHEALTQRTLLTCWHECIRDFLANQTNLTRDQHAKIEEAIWHCGLDITDTIIEAIDEVVGYHDGGAAFLDTSVEGVVVAAGIEGVDAAALAARYAVFARFPHIEAIWRPWGVPGVGQVGRVDEGAVVRDGRIGEEWVGGDWNHAVAGNWDEGYREELVLDTDRVAIRSFAVGVSTCVILMGVSWCVEQLKQMLWRWWL